MKKRFLSLFLAFAMVVCMLPLNTLTAFAATDPTTATELQSAINNGGIVKLGGDIDLGSTVLTFPDNTPVTIDLNGYNLHKPTASSYVMVIEEADSVTITDSVGTGTVTKGSGWYFFRNTGYLKIEGGIFNKSGYDLVYSKDNAVTEITGGTFTLSNIHARQSANATMTIGGGAFNIETVATGLWDEGTAIIGGTFTVTNYPSAYTDMADYLFNCFVDQNKCNIAKNSDNSYTVSKIPVPVEVGDFTILGEKELTEGTDYAYKDGILTITTTTPVTVAMKSGVTTTDDTIVVDSSVGTTYITLNNITIGTDNLGNSGTNTPITVKGENQVTLDFVGNNSLSSDVEGVYQPVYGISVESKTPFMLTSSNKGSLSISKVGFGIYTNGYTAGGSTAINGDLQLDIKDCASHSIYSNGSKCGALTISGTPVINIDSAEYAIYAYGINISGGKITIKSAKGYPVYDGSGTNITLNGSTELHIVEAKGGLRTNGGKVTITDNAKYRVYSTDADNNKIAYADRFPLISTSSSGEVEISKNAVVEIYSANDGISGGKTSIIDNAQVTIIIDTNSAYSEYALSFDDTLTIANDAIVDIDVIKGTKVRGLYDSSGIFNVKNDAKVTIDGTTYDGVYVNALNLSENASVTVNAAGDNAIYGDISVADAAMLTATSVDTRVIYDPCTVTPAAGKVYMVKYGKSKEDTSAEYFTITGTVNDKSTWRYFSVEAIDFVPVTDAIVKIDIPVKNGTPDTTAEIENDANYTVSAVNWNGNPNKFLGSNEYTATFTLTANSGFAFVSETTVTVEGAVVTKTLNNDGTLSVTARFSATGAAVPENIAVKTKPNTVEYTYGDKFNPTGLVITVTYDDGTTNDIAYNDTNKDAFSFDPADITVATTKITVTYAGKNADIDIKVNKANLTVKVNDATATYGDAVPSYTVEYEGFVNSEDKDVLGGTLVFACDYAQFSNRGAYTVKASGYTSDNYNINYVDGTLTISPKPITVTIQNATSVYGDEVAELKATDSGIVNNDTNVYSLATTATSTSNVGKYAITGTALDSNYAITFANETDAYEITKRELIITVDAKKVVVNTTLPTYTYTVSGLLDGDVFATAPTLTSDADITVIGEYDITANGADAGNNYSIMYVPAKLTVLTDSAVDAAKVYEEEIKDLDPDTVTSENKAELDEILEEINTFLDDESITDNGKKALEEVKKKVDELIKEITDAETATNTENANKVKDITSENVKLEDKTDLEKAKEDFEKALDEHGNNLTEDEKKAIEDEIKRIDDALEVIGNVEAFEELINKMLENITKNDEDAIKAADDAYNTLSDYEKSLVDKDAKKALDDAKAALAELNKPADTTSPATGDNSNMFLWIALLFISGGAVITLTVVDRKKRMASKR